MKTLAGIELKSEITVILFLQLLFYEIFASEKHSDHQYSKNTDTERGIYFTVILTCYSCGICMSSQVLCVFVYVPHSVLYLCGQRTHKISNFPDELH